MTRQILALLLLSLGLSAQNRNVRFSVRLLNNPVSPSGVHLAGDMQLAAGYASNWDPSATVLTAQGNNTYEVNLSIPDGTYQFKFINGNTWGGDESIPSACEVGGNRQVQISSDTNLTYCFALCACPPDTFNVGVQVDLSNQVGFNPSTDSVDIGGPFNGWPGNFDANYQLSDPDGDLVYTGVFRLPEPLLEYKARFHNAGGINWEPQANVQHNFSSDTTFAVRCFGSSNFGTCPDSFNVTLQVDLSQDSLFNAGADSVDIAGPFSGWSGSFNAGYRLTDADGDRVYSGTFKFLEPLLEYKARYHNGSTNWEAGANKQVNFSGDTVIAVRCFGSDTLGACPSPPVVVVPDTFSVTLQVDLSREAGFNAGSDSVDIAGPFNGWPNSFDATYAMSDANGDTIYEITFQTTDSVLEYKARYHNGQVNWEPQQNNIVINLSSDTVIGVRCFGSDTLGACPTPPVVSVPDTFSVTLQVDLSREAGFNAGSDSVDIAGPFNGWPNSFDATYAMSDANGDTIYEITFQTTDSVLEYKARYHNGQVNWEPQQNNVVVNISSDTIIAVRCFGSDTLGACPTPPVVSVPDTFSVTLQVDLSGEAGFNAGSDSVDIAGPFNGWPNSFDATYAMSDANGDTIYEITFQTTDSVLEYKARYHNGQVNWEPQQNNVLVNISSDTVIAVRCFGSDTLGACPTPPVVSVPDTFNVTLQVDLSREAGFNAASDSVDIAGPFNGWPNSFDAAYAMSDANGDTIYEITFQTTDSVLEYKARYHNGQVNWEPQQNNVLVNISSDTIIAVRCFGSDTLGACPTPPVVSVPDTFNVTLQVDLSQEAGFNAASDSVDIAGPFNAWSANYDPAYAMNDANGDTIYEITFQTTDSVLEYKARYHNGQVNWEPQQNNQVVNLSSDTIIAVRCFGSDTLGACPTPPVVVVPDTFNVTLQVDLSQETGFNAGSDSVDIAGPFNAWSANYDPAYAMSDANGDTIYEITFQTTDSVLEYKARYHNGQVNWEPQQNNVIINLSSDTVIPVRCFGSDTLGACPTPPVVVVPDTFNVTLQVDLSREAGFNAGSDSVDIAGPFNGWSATYDANYAMNDVNGDTIYEITFQTTDSVLEYKARYHNAQVNWEPQQNNIVINLSSDTIIAVRCFGSDTLGACPTPPVVVVPDTFNVTLQVDLSREVGFNAGSDSVDIAGPFNGWSATYDATYAMSDANGDTLYEITFQTTDSVLEYKARYHNGQVNWEPQQNNIVISLNSDTIIAVRCFGSDTLGACPTPPVVVVPDTFNVTLQVDLSQEAGFNAGSDSVDIAGPFNGWSATYDANYAMNDVNGDTIYEITLQTTDSVLEYKARYHNAQVNWEPQQNNVLVNISSDTIIAVRCFGSDTLGACPTPPVVVVPDTFNVTLQVDLSQEVGFNAASDSVDIAGPFNGWSATYDANYAMSDANGDTIYEITFQTIDSVLEYKARYHNGQVNWEPQQNNVVVNISSDTIITVRCFGSDTLGACPTPPVVVVPDTFNVTLQVDLSQEAGFNAGSDSVDIAGPFNGWPNSFDASYAMSDANGDTIYEITFQTTDSVVEYKARYHNGQVNWEPQQNNVFVNISSDTIIAVRCFGSDTLGACPTPTVVVVPDTFNVTLQVDLSQEAGFNAGSDSVDIAGPFNGWSATYDANYAMSDANGDTIYEITFQTTDSVLEYKARYHNGQVNWEPQQNNVFVNISSDTIIAVRCFGSDTLGACPTPTVVVVPDTFNVTLQVDLSQEAGFNAGSDSVDIAGPFNGWSATYDANYAMSDANGDTIYEITFQTTDSVLEYKARYHNGQVNWEPQQNNVFVNISSDTIIAVRCFGSDTLGACPSVPDTFLVTLQVDLSNEAGFNPSTDDVDIAGPFSAWGAALNTNYQLFDPDGDSIYTGIFYLPAPLLEYKARYHNSNGTNWETGANKLVSFNKDTVVAVRCFNADLPGACQAIIDTFWVTLQVDMNYVPGFNPLTDSVDIAGPFNNWNAGLKNAYLMTDPDGNLVYEYSIYAPETLLEYKARFHQAGVVNWESGANKQVNFTTDTIVPVRCFNTDTFGACPSPPPVPGIRFISTNTNVLESVGSINIPLLLQPTNTANDTAVFYLNRGPGLTAADFSSAHTIIGDSLYLPIPSGSDTLILQISILDDAIVESTEQLGLVLSRMVSGSINISTPSSFFLNITDNDVPVIPSYPISSINGINLLGEADSVGVYCRLQGIVNSIDFRGGAGYDFHLFENQDAINVFSPQNLGNYQVQIGDELQVMGLIQQQNGLLQIRIDSLNLLSTGNPQIGPVTVGQIDEAGESRLLRLSTFRLVNPSIWPSNGQTAIMDITNGPDTLQILIDSDTDIDGQPALLGAFDVIGIGYQNDPFLPFDEAYLLRPRQYSDFTPVNLPQVAITEVMPYSAHPFVQSGDWFEIENYGNTTISFNGYSWSDAPVQVNKNTFNSGLSIAPGEKAIVLDINAPSDTVWLNTWFQQNNGLKLWIRQRDLSGFSDIDFDGDELALFDAAGHLVSYVKYIGNDVTFGSSLEFNRQGSFLGPARNGINGAYRSRLGDIGSPGDLRPVSIEEKSFHRLTVYPNPSSGSIQIALPWPGESAIAIKDLSGKTLLSSTTQEQRSALDLSHLPSGIYLLEWRSEQHLETRKIRIY